MSSEWVTFFLLLNQPMWLSGERCAKFAAFMDSSEIGCGAKAALMRLTIIVDL